MKSKVSAVVTASVILAAFLFVGSFFQYRDRGLQGLTSDITHVDTPQTSTLDNEHGLSTDSKWPKIIWQTSKYPSENQTESERALAKTWAEMNPYYRHQMMTHERMLGYIDDNFHSSSPELEHLYLETTDYMMRTDVLRYLVLLKDGGVYNDLDVECLKPIDTWLPAQFKEKANLLIGIEIDNDLGPNMNQPGSPYLFEFVPWTIMAKPNHPFIQSVVEQLMRNMKNVSPEAQAALSQKELLRLTGPAATTVAFLAYASEITRTNVTYLNFTKITEPMMVGDVVILPIWAFGAGHQVTNSGFKNEGKALVHHHFADSWRKDHGT